MDAAVQEIKKLADKIRATETLYDAGMFCQSHEGYYVLDNDSRPCFCVLAASYIQERQLTVQQAIAFFDVVIDRKPAVDDVLAAIGVTNVFINSSECDEWLSDFAIEYLNDMCGYTPAQIADVLDLMVTEPNIQVVYSRD